MNKTVKRIISVVLAVALLCGVAVVGVTADSSTTSGDTSSNPVIILPGINHSLAYVADEDGNPILNSKGHKIESQTIILDTDALIPVAIKYALLPLLLTLGLQSDVGWTKAVTKIAEEAFKYQSADDEGNTYHNIEVYRYGSMAGSTLDGTVKAVDEAQYEWFCRMVPIQPLVAEIGAENVFFFTFNLAGDPMESARELDEYIQKVKKETGKDQVNLLSVSLGGTLFTAYTELFKEKNDVSRAVNVVAVLNGTNVIDDFYKRSWSLGDEDIYKNLFPEILGGEGELTLGYLINVLIRIFPRSVLEGTLTAAYDVLYNNMLTKVPQLWAMCSKETYAEIIDKVIPSYKYPVLREKLDAFQSARINLESNIKYMMDNGCEVNNICGYNLHTGDIQYAFFKVIGSTNKVNSDAIINIESTSIGCTAALPGEKLSGVTAGDRYISPDADIDASTCALPNNTWFFKDMHHEDAANTAPAMNLVLELLCKNEIKDIDSAPEKYPQFNYGTNNKKLRRWYMNDAKACLADESFVMTDAQRAEIKAALAEAETLMAATIGNSAEVNRVTIRLNNALADAGYMNYSHIDSLTKEQDPGFAKTLSDLMYKLVGPKGFSDLF